MKGSSNSTLDVLSALKAEERRSLKALEGDLGISVVVDNYYVVFLCPGDKFRIKLRPYGSRNRVCGIGHDYGLSLVGKLLGDAVKVKLVVVFLLKLVIFYLSSRKEWTYTRI